MNLMVRRNTHKKNTSACLCSILKKGTIYTSTEGASLPVKPSWQTAVKKNTHYPASRFFSLALLLAFTKSFASLVSRIVGLFYEPRGQQPKSSFQTATLPALFQQSYITLRELAGLGE